jgi:hypothetical protein
VLSALKVNSLEQTILKGKGNMTSQPIEDTVFGYTNIEDKKFVVLAYLSAITSVSWAAYHYKPISIELLGSPI